MRRSVLVLALLAACGPFRRGGGNDGAPPASFVRSTSELRSTRMLEVRPGIARADAMKLVADALGKRFVVEVTDPAAGFTMTAWRANASRAGVPDLRYRTRVVTRFLGDDWRRLQLRSEANWARGDEWEIGYDVAQLDTATRELQSQLGPRP